MTTYDVTIIGAGPYGLSAGAFLKSKGLGVRVFGKPMEFWADKMPKGMLLRSPREASTIADPGSHARWRHTKLLPVRRQSRLCLWKHLSITGCGSGSSCFQIWTRRLLQA